MNKGKKRKNKNKNKNRKTKKKKRKKKKGTETTNHLRMHTWARDTVPFLDVIIPKGIRGAAL